MSPQCLPLFCHESKGPVSRKSQARRRILRHQGVRLRAHLFSDGQFLRPLQRPVQCRKDTAHELASKRKKLGGKREGRPWLRRIRDRDSSWDYLAFLIDPFDAESQRILFRPVSLYESHAEVGHQLVPLLWGLMSGRISNSKTPS